MRQDAKPGGPSIALPPTGQLPAPNRRQAEKEHEASSQSKQPPEVLIFDGYGSVADAASVIISAAALIGILATFWQTWSINREARLRGEAETRAYVSPHEIAVRVHEAAAGGDVKYAFILRNPGKSPANRVHIVQDDSAFLYPMTFPVMAESEQIAWFTREGEFSGFVKRRDELLCYEFRFYVFYLDVFGYVHGFNVGGYIKRDVGEIIDPVGGLKKIGILDGAKPLEEDQWERYLPKALKDYKRFKHREPPRRIWRKVTSILQR